MLHLKCTDIDAASVAFSSVVFLPDILQLRCPLDLLCSKQGCASSYVGSLELAMYTADRASDVMNIAIASTTMLWDPTWNSCSAEQQLHGDAIHLPAGLAECLTGMVPVVTVTLWLVTFSPSLPIQVARLVEKIMLSHHWHHAKCESKLCKVNRSDIHYGLISLIGQNSVYQQIVLFKHASFLTLRCPAFDTWSDGLYSQAPR